jgi:hypothetical protein
MNIQNQGPSGIEKFFQGISDGFQNMLKSLGLAGDKEVTKPHRPKAEIPVVKPQEPKTETPMKAQRPAAPLPPEKKLDLAAGADTVKSALGKSETKQVQQQPAATAVSTENQNKPPAHEIEQTAKQIRILQDTKTQLRHVSTPELKKAELDKIMESPAGKEVVKLEKNLAELKQQSPLDNAAIHKLEEKLGYPTNFENLQETAKALGSVLKELKDLGLSDKGPEWHDKRQELLNKQERIKAGEFGPTASIELKKISDEEKLIPYERELNGKYFEKGDEGKELWKKDHGQRIPDQEQRDDRTVLRDPAATQEGRFAGTRFADADNPPQQKIQSFDERVDTQFEAAKNKWVADMSQREKNFTEAKAKLGL